MFANSRKIENEEVYAQVSPHKRNAAFWVGVSYILGAIVAIPVLLMYEPAARLYQYFDDMADLIFGGGLICLFVIGAISVISSLKRQA